MTLKAAVAAEPIHITGGSLAADTVYDPSPVRNAGVSTRGGESTLLRAATILAGTLALAHPAHAQTSQMAATKAVPTITKKEAWSLYSKLHGAWNSESIAERVRIAGEVLDENIEYRTVRHDTTFGRALVIEDMQTFHDIFPGGHFEIGDVSAHHNVALLTWVLIQADGTEFARGGDMISVGSNGKITKITTFGPSSRTPD